jgi:arylformamidase
MSPDPVDLEREYSPSSVSKQPAPWYIEQYAQRSATVRASLGDRLEKCHYGPGVDEYSLVARHSDDAPLLVFIHGGYWKALSADDCCMWAAEALDSRCSFASVNYTLAPTASLERIVAQCREALRWLGAESGMRPRKTVIAGSSAGGHLAAMCSTASPTPTSIDAAVLLSGVYDLVPLLPTTVNDAIMLTRPDAVRLSPQHLAVTKVETVVAAWGEEETSAFKQQSRDYVAKIAGNGVAATALEVPGRDHFDLIYDLLTPGTPLGDITISLLS